MNKLTQITKSIFLISGLSLAFLPLVNSFNVQEAKAQSVKCVNVSSKRGWQNFALGGRYTRIATVSGGWSVDSRNYDPVGPEGHDEPGLDPHNAAKYDQEYPFGALIVDIPTNSHGYIWVEGSQQLPEAITRTRMRINDIDAALGDNSGVLRVCFAR